MSRGPGKWERAILETLERVPSFYLTDLLPDPHTRSQTVALNRAMRKLDDTGKIAVEYWSTRSWEYSGHGYSREQGEQPHGFVTIFRVGCPLPGRKDVQRLKSCTVIPEKTMQRLVRRSPLVLDDVDWHRVDEK
jgi:hypothetical protein